MLLSTLGNIFASLQWCRPIVASSVPSVFKRVQKSCNPTSAALTKLSGEYDEGNSLLARHRK
eukprot:6459099-Amphidinium_carterae.2